MVRSHLRLALVVVAVLALAACKKKKAEPPRQAAPAPAAAPATSTPQKSARTVRAAVNQPAPDFELKDEEGRNHKLSAYRGKVVVLEWTSPRCPFVRRCYGRNEMKKALGGVDAGKVVWLAVDSSHFNKPADSAAWRKKKAFGYPVLQDPSGRVGHMYGARTTPHMYVIDTAGVLRYVGAIDNNPRGTAAQPVNYVNAALKAILAGKHPSPAQTRPYGCSVKYQS